MGVPGKDGGRGGEGKRCIQIYSAVNKGNRTKVKEKKNILIYHKIWGKGREGKGYGRQERGRKG